jgi:hypothetical protein
MSGSPQRGVLQEPGVTARRRTRRSDAGSRAMALINLGIKSHNVAWACVAKALLPASDRPNASVQTRNDTALSERRRGAAGLAADGYDLMLRARTPTCCSTWTAGLGFRSASPATAAADRLRPRRPADRGPRRRHQPRPDALLPLASTGNSAARLNPTATQPSRPTAPLAMTSAPTAAPVALPR